jgi:hypothetical protein
LHVLRLIQTRWLVCLVLFGAALLCTAAAWAGAIPAPSVVLQHPRNQVVVGNYLGRYDDGRYRFAKVADLRGPDDTPDEIVLWAPDWLASWLSQSKHYLFAYSNYVGNPRFPKQYLIDTNGPRMITTLGLEPALFIDTPEARKLLLHSLDKTYLHSAQFREEIVTALSSADTQIQNFAAAEVSQRPELRKRDDAPLLAAVKALLTNPDAQPAARAGLLRVVAARVEVYGKDFLSQTVGSILQQAPLSGYQDLRPRSGELVQVALALVQDQSIVVPMTSLERLVACDSAPLSESALLAIRHIDAARERVVASAALEQTQLPAVTREFLLDHIRRLDLAGGTILQPASNSR